MSATITQMDRREFLKVTALAGGGVVIGLYLPVTAQQGGGNSVPASVLPSDYITIHPDNTFTIVAKNPETGQGIRVALPQIIADEFDVEWSQVKIHQADLHPKYNPQSEGGSRAIPVNYDRMRQVGAGGRLMLMHAAAQMWNVPVPELTTGRGVVTHAASRRTATYASLAPRLAAMTPPVPEAVQAAYKDPRNFGIIGKPIPGVDNLAIVTGKPAFSIDVEPEGTLFAAFEKCPVFGGKVVSANVDEIKGLPGIRHAFVVEAAGQGNNSLTSGVAIVADSWWVANNARRSLKVVWDEGQVAAQSSVGFAAKAKELFAQFQTAPAAPAAPTTGGRGGGPAIVGDVESAFASAAKSIEAEYFFPFLSHATLEPQNSTAHYKADGTLEVWSPSQTPNLNHPALGSGVEASKITMHLVRGGGGFGRRLVSEYDIEVSKIARVVSDERRAAGLATVPVKLIWTREDDLAHDQYRPGGYHFLKAGLDATGRLVAFRDFVASTNSVVPANEFPRGHVPNFLVNSAPITPFMIPTGALRAPPTNGVSFVMQSFIDEVAIAAGKDPLQYRLDLLATSVVSTQGPANTGRGGAAPPQGGGGFNPSRARGVLEAVRDMSDWNNRSRLPRGTAKGVAFQFAHAGYVAYVVEIAVSDDKRISVNKVWTAVDVGRQIVNLSSSRNQVEGAFVEGMSHLMNWQITIDKGRVVQTNLHVYQPTRMAHVPPAIEVKFLQTDFDPTGLGEPALPAAIPAICNALFAATGVRIRSLPIGPAGYSWA